VIRLDHRPGHFLVAGTAPRHGLAADRGLGTSGVGSSTRTSPGPHRTLMQDPVFAIDQLVEIAIRALSPAVNDTFTALTCIDWLSAGLSRALEAGGLRGRLSRPDGHIRLLTASRPMSAWSTAPSTRCASAASGMPAVLIRLLDSMLAGGRGDDEPAPA
jgi:uncharacterized membrane protein